MPMLASASVRPLLQSLQIGSWGGAMDSSDSARSSRLRVRHVYTVCPTFPQWAQRSLASGHVSLVCRGLPQQRQPLWVLCRLPTSSPLTLFWGPVALLAAAPPRRGGLDFLGLCIFTTGGEREALRPLCLRPWCELLWLASLGRLKLRSLADSRTGSVNSSPGGARLTVAASSVGGWPAASWLLLICSADGGGPPKPWLTFPFGGRPAGFFPFPFPLPPRAMAHQTSDG